MGYGPDGLVEHKVAHVNEIRQFATGHAVTWVHVSGTGDVTTLGLLGDLFGLHPLALEDVANGHQRAKVEHYGELIFMIARLPSVSTGTFETEQLSIFIGPNFVISFEERVPDSFDLIRSRIRAPGSRTRALGTDYLAYSLLDSAIDRYYPILETFGERLENLEDEVVTKPSRKTVELVHLEKRDLMMMRRAIWPLRDAMNNLLREDHPLIGANTRVFLRDCYDHTVQILDLTETYRELGSDLMDIYLSSVSNRMNEIMKVLTIISTIFIPLNFIAGVYGMNFHTEASPWNMPELNWRYGYLVTLGFMLLVALSLVFYFWRKGWIGEGPDQDHHFPVSSTHATPPPLHSASIPAGGSPAAGPETPPSA